MKNHKNKLLLSASALILLAVVVPFAVHAMTIKSGDSVFIEDEINGNLFAAGNSVIIDTVVNGDIFVAGNNIIIKGVINGDVFAAGNTVKFEGVVNGSLRTVGSSIEINGAVWRNILSAANNLTVSEGSVVGGHITYAGANLIVDSSVGGQVDAAVNKLIVSKNAIIGGDLFYKSRKEADIREGADIRGISTFSLLKKSSGREHEGIFEGFVAFWKIVGLFSLLAAALLVTYLLPGLTDKVYEHMHNKFWQTFGLGLVSVVVVPIVCALLFMTVLAIPLVFVFLAMYLIGIFFGKVLAVISIGKFMSEKIGWDIPKVLVVLLAGLIFFTVSLIPILGWLAACIIVLAAIGGLIKAQAELAQGWR